MRQTLIRALRRLARPFGVALTIAIAFYHAYLGLYAPPMLERLEALFYVLRFRVALEAPPIAQKIVIVDYGVGNTYSVSNAINHLGYTNLRISDKATVIAEADALILPGVGAFDACINNLKERGLHTILNEEVLVKKKPLPTLNLGV